MTDEQLFPPRPESVLIKHIMPQPPTPPPPHTSITRRHFTQLAGATLTSAFFTPAVFAVEPSGTPHAGDLVELGNTGVLLSRVGMGTGSRGGWPQRNLGQQGFNKLIRHGIDRGLTYIDTADNYDGMHEMVRDAIQGIPRENLFIQSKIWDKPDDVAGTLDRCRKELGVDYIDSVLLHCVVKPDWDTHLAPVMDGLRDAKAKGIIRIHGVSSHSQPGVARAAELDWVDHAFVRINPMGKSMDTDTDQRGMNKSTAKDIPGALAQIQKVKDAGKGIIGMKIIGNGSFKEEAQRRRSIRFAMHTGLPDAINIGFKSTAEIDEAIRHVNQALANPEPAETFD